MNDAVEDNKNADGKELLTIGFSHLKEHAQNVFELENPAIYGCKVFDYLIGHSTMTIQVGYIDSDTQIPEVFYIIFDSVIYFSGPLRWRGANFQVSPIHEYINLRRRIEVQEPLIDSLYTKNWPDDYLESLSGRLLHVDTLNDIQIQILAHGATISNTPLWP